MSLNLTQHETAAFLSDRSFKDQSNLRMAMERMQSTSYTDIQWKDRVDEVRPMLTLVGESFERGVEAQLVLRKEYGCQVRMDDKLEAVAQLADLSVKQANSTMVCLKAVESMTECVDVRVDLLTAKVDTLGKITLDLSEQVKLQDHSETIDSILRMLARVQRRVHKLSETK